MDTETDHAAEADRRTRESHALAIRVMEMLYAADITPDHDLAVAFAWIATAVMRNEPMRHRALFALMMLTLLHLDFAVSDGNHAVEPEAASEMDEDAVTMLRHQMANMAGRTH